MASIAEMAYHIGRMIGNRSAPLMGDAEVEIDERELVLEIGNVRLYWQWDRDNVDGDFDKFYIKPREEVDVNT